MADSATNNELTREEKLRKRQEQLAAWKQRKEQEDAAKNGEISSKVDEQKKLERQQRLEQWKKRKLGTPPADAPSKRKVMTISHSKAAPKPEKVLKKSVFESDDEEDAQQNRRQFVRPTLNGKTKQLTDQGDVDELDQFLSELNDKENRRAVDINESESEDELDADEEEQELLKSKFQKLNDREKRLDVVDHTQVTYSPFRKSFYQPPAEFEQLTDEEIAQIRYGLSEIVVRGECPIPISKWSQLGLPSSVMTVLDQHGYDTPSPIQCQAIPAAMSGSDIIGVAKTGSGKTLAFLLPMLRHVQDQRPLAKGDGPIALILTPTRELAIQIHKELNHFKVLGLSSCCCYGGSSIEPQIAELKRGVQIVVGTPGRVIDLLTVNGGRVTNLHRVTYLVLDEADRMFDMGFEPQVNKIFNQVRPDKQTVLFSATFPNKMEQLAKKGLRDPVKIIVGGISKVAPEITQKVELFDAAEDTELNREKIRRLHGILDEFFQESPESKVLIFVEKQTAADQLMVQLLSSEYPSLAIHGGKDQMDRKHAIKEFSSGGVSILIATSIAARGLDVKKLDLVINYDAPNHMEDYVHRVGRTGRAGNTGTAITFVTKDQERSIADLVKAMKLSGQHVEDELEQISQGFFGKVKTGKAKYSSGFGGKGLEKLQETRQTTRDLERKTFDDTAKDSGAEPSAADVDSQLPDFTVIEGRAPETSGPDKSKFHSRITINDLPQTARWAVVARDSLSKIIEATQTSITNKGQYYGPNYKGKTDIPKLYLLVEGLTEAAVAKANQMIRQKMIEGLVLAADTSSKVQGKYTV